MSQKISFSLTTLPIDEKDIYLYSSAQSSETQVIPSSLPIVLGVLSVNADDMGIDVCEMDQTGYISFLTKRNNNNGIDATPQCLRHTTKKIDIKNHFWSVTPTKIDLEKDILKQNLSTPYVYIRGSV